MTVVEENVAGCTSVEQAIESREDTDAEEERQDAEMGAGAVTVTCHIPTVTLNAS